jgi:hypothetical protein
VFLAYGVDRFFLEERIRKFSLSAKDEDLLVLEREPLNKILKQSELYETLKRTNEVHRSRFMPRHSNRNYHLVQTGDRRDGQGILPPGK